MSAQLVGLTPSLLNWRQPCLTLAEKVSDAKAVIAMSNAEGMELPEAFSLEIINISIDGADEGTLPQWSWTSATPVVSLNEL